SGDRPPYKLVEHVNRPTSRPAHQLTRRYPSLFLSTRSGRTDLYFWPYAYFPSGIELLTKVDAYFQAKSEIGRFRSRKMRGFWQYGHADDRAGCWINEDFKLHCMRRGECRSTPSLRDRSNYFGVNLGRLGKMTDLSLSSAAACATQLGSGQVLCWGDTQGWGLPDTSRCAQQSGERIGRRADEARDAEALPGVDYVVQLSAGEHHHLGLTDQGDVFEWGWDWQLEEIMEPKLHQFDELAIAVAGAHQTRCVLFLGGQVGCWGRFRGSPDGPGGDLHIVEGLPPVVELLDGWQNKHMCVLTEDERVFCWGKNNLGQLGDFTGIDEDLPIEIDLSLAD
ncbi:MAG: hypothetical protein VYB65_08655, partial [Myxococcota bacterium]|nr:hypothetical protein [Myxococcota bacterium]